MRRVAGAASIILQIQIGLWLLVALTQAVKIVTSLSESSTVATWGGLVISLSMALGVTVVFVWARNQVRLKHPIALATLALCAVGNIWVMWVVWESSLMSPGTSAVLMVVLFVLAIASLAAAIGQRIVAKPSA